MRSPNYFLVKPKGGDRYNNSEKVGDTDLIANNTIEDGHSTNREGIVIKTPEGYEGDVEEGDTIIVHHNTFRLMVNQRGVMVNSMKHVKDDIFYADDFYMRIDKEGNKTSNPPYVFVKPIVRDEFMRGLTEQEKEGEAVFVPKEIEKLGIKNGQKYAFKDFSNYQFKIDGEKYFRMKYTDILAEI